MDIRFPSVRTETEFFAFQGGVDAVSPALRMPAGAVIKSQNYEPAIEGGYTRMKGYERFDGRPRPSDAPISGALTPIEEATNLVASAAVRRALIGAPVGSGAVRGVCYYAGSLYAFRDNAGGTAGVMHKSSAGGWAAVALGEEVLFTNANTNVGEGDTLTQGAVTALVRRVVLETGTLLSGINTGRLILSGRAGGNYAAGAATSTGSGAVTLGGIQTAITLPAGGRYEFEIANFFGGTSSIRMYGCNGVGRAFEFDGTTFITLRTGAAVDTPGFIKVNRRYLYLAVGSSLINGSVGEPYRFVTSEGATEFAVGDTITGIVGLAGEALGVLCRNTSFALVGTSQSTWQLDTIRADMGCVPYTAKSMSETFMLDDRGVVSFSTAQEYGNFADATLSRKIQPLVDAIRGKVVGACVFRQKGHYVLYCNDGSMLTMGVSNKQVAGFLLGRIEFTPACIWSGEDETGIERVFLGATNGFIYEMDRGSTFDGAAIESYLKIYYYNSKSPRIRKRYRKLILEMSSVLFASLRFSAEYSYGDAAIRATTIQDFTTGGTGGSWDFVNWDEFFWDSIDVLQPELSLDGTGLNIALTFGSNTTLDFGHTLQGALIHYTLRRQQR